MKNKNKNDWTEQDSFERSKWNLYAKILTKNRERKDQVNMVKNLLKRLLNNEAITKSDLRLMREFMGDSLYIELYNFSQSPEYLKAMSHKRTKKRTKQKQK